MHGDITLGYGDFVVLDTPRGDDCTGDGGYDDIRTGAQVIIRDGAGSTLAVGQLSRGVVEPYSRFECSFIFGIPEVPPGRSFYSVEVAGRGELTYDEADIGEPLAFTLG